MNENALDVVCENCKKVYESKFISEIAKFRGIIVYEGEEHNLIGLTCIDCSKTTIKKFKHEDIRDCIAELRGYRRERIQRFYNILPFSYEILTSTGVEDLPEFVSEKKGEQYRLPANEGFELWPIYKDERMPSYFRNISTSLWESDIPALLKIENEHCQKVFPRLSWNYSIYHTYDVILYRMDDKFTSDDYETSLGKLFCDRLLLYFYLNNDFHDKVSNEDRRKFYDMVSSTRVRKNLYFPKTKNDKILTLLEYEDIDSYLCYHEGNVPDEISEKITHFRKEYSKTRNRLDFEIVYRDELIYPQAKQLFYSPAWREVLDDVVMNGLEGGSGHFSRFSLGASPDLSPMQISSGRKILDSMSPSKDREKPKKRRRKAKAKNNAEPVEAQKVIEIAKLDTQEQRIEYVELLKEVEELEAQYPSLKKIVALSKPMLELKKELVDIAEKKPISSSMVKGAQAKP